MKHKIAAGNIVYGIIIKHRSLVFQAIASMKCSNMGGPWLERMEGKCYLWRGKAERMLRKESPSEGGRKAQMGYREPLWGPHLQSPQSFVLMTRMHSCIALVIDSKAQRLKFFVS